MCSHGLAPVGRGAIAINPAGPFTPDPSTTHTSVYRRLTCYSHRCTGMPVKGACVTTLMDGLSGMIRAGARTTHVAARRRSYCSGRRGRVGK